MKIKSVIRDALEQATAATYSAMGKPHNRPRKEVQRKQVLLEDQAVDALRTRLISEATGRGDAEVRAFVDDFEKRPWSKTTLKTENITHLYGMPPMDRKSLHALIHAHEPTICVETGVAAGFSATVILSYLVEKDKGLLHSLDIEGPTSHDYGIVIPEEYRDRWEMHLQKDVPLLPKILADLGEVDLFYHDSDHDVQHVLWECEVAWPYVKSGGCLATHDVFASTAFEHFMTQNADSIAAGGAIGNFGFVIKR